MAIIAEEPEILSHLERMGVPLAALSSAVAAGAGGFVATTRFHPISAPGTYLYHEASAGLRRGLERQGGWDFDDDDGQPRTLSADRGISIVVQTGNKDTGRDTGTEPKTRNSKGSVTYRKVSANFEQLELFNLAPSAPTSREAGEVLTWILLVAIVGEEVRSELSLPRAWSASGKPCGWHTRILLPVQVLGSGSPIDLADSADAGPATDIAVEWKQ